MTTNVDRYWEQYLASIAARAKRPSRQAGTAAFGISWDDAREIAALVRNGRKTASGSLVWSNEVDGKPGSRPGDLWVVIAGPDEPVCIIQTIDVSVLPYDEVPAKFAREGGEGDRTVCDWRRIYWKYIVSECKRIGRQPTVKALLAMERFRVVYSKPLSCA
jgi:uncharacterized protein YhfF